ncbi:hypothetical protein RJ639_019604 [Escallonia herrerae]|uniref:HAT C-terminal dimerisation domain-containing protein n=1 Tax=Escallonia herrerae TaxID=1293975 RepID=A0AA89AJQ7_9ASTE|nr:hypothetical protein RJ639_019604 [Escallonia herrerae]
METPECEELIDEDENEEPSATPLWKYVTKIYVESSAKGGGGSNKFVCNFGCRSEPCSGSYIRVRYHLIGTIPGTGGLKKNTGINMCSKITRSEREALVQEEVAANQLFGGNSKARKLLAGKSAMRPHPRNDIDKMFRINHREDVDQQIARCMICVSKLWKVRTTLLDREYNKVKQNLKPLMDDWDIYGMSMISDGFSNCKNQSLINVMAASKGKAMFLSAHDCSSIEKRGLNIAEILLKEIESIGPEKVVQVVTDNAANCKLAGNIIEKKYPWIFWSGCLLNLLMKDFAKCTDSRLSFVSETYKRAKSIVKYINNHSCCQSLFKTFHSLELLKVKKKNRFGHHFIVLTRLITVRVGLVSMVLSKQWENLRKSGVREEHDKTQRTIMDDDFWRKCERLVKFTKPIYKMIRFFDSDKAIIGEVYEQMDTMLGLIKDELLDDFLVYDLVHDFVVERWDKMNLPLHCLAYVLVPKYSLLLGFLSLLQGAKKGKKPHFDIEVQKGYFQALERLITDPTESGLVRQQISDFVSCKGVFSQPQAVADRATMEVVAWWDMYGGGAPELHCLALKVLSQSVKSSCAERCWSTYSYIHNVKRNRLGAPRAEELDANPEITNIEQSGASLEAVEAYEKDDDIDEGNDDDVATTNPMTPGRSSTPSLTVVTPTSTTSFIHSTSSRSRSSEASTPCKD